MFRIDLLIFDFDGTLVSSGEDIAASVNEMLRVVGLPQRDEREIIGFVGDGTAKLIERSLGPDHLDRYEEALNLFRTHYSRHMMDRTRLYPGILDVLEFFSGKKKLIVTNKLHQFTFEIAESLGIGDYFQAIVARDSHRFSKPDPRLLESLMGEFGARPDRTAVIGDGINDIIMAKGAGAWSCAHLNGLTPREALLKHQPDFTYEDPSELKSLFF